MIPLTLSIPDLQTGMGGLLRVMDGGRGRGQACLNVSSHLFKIQWERRGVEPTGALRWVVITIITITPMNGLDSTAHNSWPCSAERVTNTTVFNENKTKNIRRNQHFTLIDGFTSGSSEIYSLFHNWGFTILRAFLFDAVLIVLTEHTNRVITWTKAWHVLLETLETFTRQIWTFNCLPFDRVILTWPVATQFPLLDKPMYGWFSQLDDPWQFTWPERIQTRRMSSVQFLPSNWSPLTNNT